MAFSDSGEIETRLLARAAEDEGLRARLIDDPKATISAALGINHPEWSAVQVHQNTALPGTSSCRHPIFSLRGSCRWLPVVKARGPVRRTRRRSRFSGLNRPARRWQSCLPHTAPDHVGFHAA